MITVMQNAERNRKLSSARFTGPDVPFPSIVDRVQDWYEWMRVTHVPTVSIP